MPSFLISFEHQPNTFVGRGEHLASIARGFGPANKRAASYGLGGVEYNREIAFRKSDYSKDSGHPELRSHTYIGFERRI